MDFSQHRALNSSFTRHHLKIHTGPKHIMLLSWEVQHTRVVIAHGTQTTAQRATQELMAQRSNTAELSCMTHEPQLHTTNKSFLCMDTQKLVLIMPHKSNPLLCHWQTHKVSRKTTQTHGTELSLDTAQILHKSQEKHASAAQCDADNGALASVFRQCPSLHQRQTFSDSNPQSFSEWPSPHISMGVTELLRVARVASHSTLHVRCM